MTFLFMRRRSKKEKEEKGGNIGKRKIFFLEEKKKEENISCRKTFSLRKRTKRKRMRIFFSAKEKKNGEGEEAEWRRKRGEIFGEGNIVVGGRTDVHRRFYKMSLWT